jgi:hypothetical protein
LVESSVGDTHAPNKFINIGYLFLMGFGEDIGGTPSSQAQSNPTIVEENLNLGHNDLVFMGPITRIPAADWWRPASINSEFEMKDGFHDASRIKAIPIGLNDGDNASTDSKQNRHQHI